MNIDSQTQKFPIVLLSIFVISLLLLLNSAAETVSFKFNVFDQVQENLIFQGDAKVYPLSNGYLQLTDHHTGAEGVYSSVGRVLYETPIQIWNGVRDTMASFQTNFSFFIGPVDPSKIANGFVFFLAPVDTQPPQGEPGLLGIFSDVPSLETREPIVAVEFDTFSDPWDPKGKHIGIDINSIKSRTTTPWTYKDSHTAQVSISYDAPTCSLNVSLSYYWGEHYSLKESVGLRDVLPQWVRIGFSATTGNSSTDLLVDRYFVSEWSFYSELPDYKSTKGFKKTKLISEA